MPNKTPLPSDPAFALREIDKELTTLLARRAELLCGLKPRTPSQAKRRQWQDLEKELWQLWEQAAQQCRSDVRAWRKIFSQAQELSADTAPESEGRSYVLAPRKEPVRVNIQGPPCTLSARLWAVLAAQVKQPFTAPRILRNDPFIELVKALNQAGASLFWDDGGLHSRAQSTATFSEGVIYAGEDPQNLLLLMGLCLGRAGASRFTGGAGLKLLDLAAMRNFLPQLGARLAFMHPGSNSVPFRLECSGVLPDQAHLPRDMEPGLAAKLGLALCLASPGFRRDFTLSWDEPLEPLAGPLLATGAELLQQCGLTVLQDPGRLEIRAGELQLPERVELPLDGFLSAALLALPLFTGGRTMLKGRWPHRLPQWRGLKTMLQSAGLRVDAEEGQVRSVPLDGAAFRAVEAQGAPEALPLALSLAAWQAVQSGKPAPVQLDLPGEPEAAACLELAGLLGLDAAWKGSSLVLTKNPEALQDTLSFVAPDARWCLAAALGAFSRPGLLLANPGNVAELAPNFWKLFNALPDPGFDSFMPRPPKVQEDVHDNKRRRRIIPG